MLRRNLLIGGLVAGAFVLPSLAQAGVVSGACVNCHTMHATNGNGTAITLPSAQLLKGSGCVGCHTGGANGAATGRDAAKFNAPQVSDLTNVLSGGFFTMTGGVDANIHNVAGDAGADGALGTTPPGSAGTRTGSLADGFTCSDCHDASGGHHGSAAGTYRLLTGVTGTGDANYGVQAATAANGIGNRSANTYSADLNAFCASCHGTFHAGNQGTAATTWTRHPTDLAMDAATNGGGIQTTLTAGTIGDQTPLSTNGVANGVMCISCHVPHGGANADLLAFTYSATVNVAGGAVKSIGCETCHSYGVAGM